MKLFVKGRLDKKGILCYNITRIMFKLLAYLRGRFKYLERAVSEYSKSDNSCDYEFYLGAYIEVGELIKIIEGLSQVENTSEEKDAKSN